MSPSPPLPPPTLPSRGKMPPKLEPMPPIAPPNWTQAPMIPPKPTLIDTPTSLPRLGRRPCPPPTLSRSTRSFSSSSSRRAARIASCSRRFSCAQRTGSCPRAGRGRRLPFRLPSSAGLAGAPGTPGAASRAGRRSARRGPGRGGGCGGADSAAGGGGAAGAGPAAPGMLRRPRPRRMGVCGRGWGAGPWNGDPQGGDGAVGVRDIGLQRGGFREMGVQLWISEGGGAVVSVQRDWGVEMGSGEMEVQKSRAER